MSDFTDLMKYQKQYQEVTDELNVKIIERANAKATYECLNAEVAKLTNLQAVALEGIRCEKKIMESTR